MTAKKYLSIPVLAVILIAGTSVQAAVPETCDVQLSVELTPDAVSPRDQGFLNALIADPQYEIRWVQGSETNAVFELRGPASDDQCSEGVDRLGRSSHVLDVKVIQPGSSE
jgi:hypothetical protein